MARKRLNVPYPNLYAPTGEHWSSSRRSWLLVLCPSRLFFAPRACDVTAPLPVAPGHKHEKEFNCIQRGHQNTVESLAVFTPLFFLTAIAHPRVAAVAAVFYFIGRTLYARASCMQRKDSAWQSCSAAFQGWRFL